MKKLLTTIFAAALLAIPAQAQHYRESEYYNPRTDHLDYNRHREGLGPLTGRNYYGLRIGAAFSTVNSDDKSLDGGSAQTGLNIGVVAGLSLSERAPLFFETGLSYVEKGGKKTLNGKKMTYDLNYLEVPLVIKYIYELDGGLSIQPFLGGYLACGVGGKIKNFGERAAFNSFSDDAFKRFDGGIRLGCGVGFDLFYLDLSYDIGLANICHDYFDTSHNGCLSLTAGVNF